MLNYIILILALVGCGKDDSTESAESPSVIMPTVAQKTPTVSPVPTAAPSAAPAKKIAAITPSPSPSASPSAISLEMIVSQPFETNDDAFDFRNMSFQTNASGDRMAIANSKAVYKKTAAGTLTCWLRVEVRVEAGNPIGTITFIKSSGSQTPGCWDAGESTRYIWYQIGQCQGYNQDTYKCGTSGVTYDLVNPY